MGKSVGIYTLGCKVNQYESEAIAQALSARGFTVSDPDGACELYVVNTCTVTAESDRKARQFIRRAHSHNPAAPVLVTGCLAQVAPRSISRMEGVYLVCGNSNKMAVVDYAVGLLQDGAESVSPVCNVPPLVDAPFERMSICHFGRTRAYVKIEDGCENRCTYCIIPAARGPVRSKPEQDVLDEVRTLTENGCREVVLTGIETASWGRDLVDASLGDLLEKVNAIEGIGRIRLGSLDPSLMRKALVDKLAGLDSLTPHFHLSVQSGSDQVLHRMKRKYNRTQALEAIERLRQAIPGVQLTTDIIVGFPGESEEDFEQTLDLARRARFLMIHVFPYSPRAGTPAAEMPDQIPQHVKKERVRILRALSNDIRRELLQQIIDQDPVKQVLFETFREGVATGHTPEFIEVRVPSDRPLHAQTLSVRLTGVTPDGEACLGVPEHSPEKETAYV